ncbi:MAG TPA: hypothetical protein VF132_05275 [Rudaea sp.]
MDSFKPGPRKPVARFFDRVFGTQPAPMPEKRMQNLLQKQAKIRAVSVRRGFEAIRARSDEMAERLEQYKRQRTGVAAADAAADGEAIVLSSGSSRA